MRAGTLDRSVTIQRRAETVAASGSVTETWTDLIACRAELRAPTAEELATGFGEAERETVIFTVRWHPTPISTGDRILCAGRFYDIKQIVEIGRRQGWQLKAVAA